MNNGNFLIYLTARNRERGEEALENLKKDEKLSKAKALASNGGLTDIKYHQLDIGDTKSIDALKNYLHNEHPDGIDILINNAGVALNGFSQF